MASKGVIDLVKGGSSKDSVKPVSSTAKQTDAKIGSGKDSNKSGNMLSFSERKDARSISSPGSVSPSAENSGGASTGMTMGARKDFVTDADPEHKSFSLISPDKIKF